MRGQGLGQSTRALVFLKIAARLALSADNETQTERAQFDILSRRSGDSGMGWAWGGWWGELRDGQEMGLCVIMLSIFSQF